MLFVSHANPEDNEFARWLSLRLAAEGYPVWCDVTQLLGGERFWTDIETALRERTSRFLFVLSRHSNHKDGPLDELNLALTISRSAGLADFVIPLRIDDLPPSEFNVRLGQINAISFQESWASGLRQLMAKLDKVGTPRDARFGPEAVGEWWVASMGESRGLKDEPETLQSNVYLVQPTSLFVYRPAPSSPLRGLSPTVPHVFRSGLLGTLLPPRAVAAHDPSLELVSELPLSAEAMSKPPQGWGFGDLRYVVSRLLNDHWCHHVDRLGLPRHTFANGQPAVFTTLGDLGFGRVSFPSPSDRQQTSTRQLMGFKTLSSAEGELRRRYWHFAVEPQAHSDLGLGFVMKPHVVFSDDGYTVWKDDARLHRARRSQCKDWWNDKWRDLITAALSRLAQGKSCLDLSHPEGGDLRVSTSPVLILAPVSYDEPTAQPRDQGVDEDTSPEAEDEVEDETWD